MRLCELMEDRGRTRYRTEPRSTGSGKYELIKHKDDLAIALHKYHHNVTIYRGYTNPNEDAYVYLIDPSKATRKSAYTTNHYTLMIDNMPSWKAFPKRSQSLVGVSAQWAAGGYGDVYVVLPLGDPKIGVCPAGDFWSSFSNVWNTLGVGRMNDFNRQLVNLSKLMLGKPLRASNFDVLKDDIDKMTKIYWESHQAYAKYQRWFQVDDDLWATLEQALDPYNNDFQIMPLSKLGEHEHREYWLSSPCFMVRESYLDFLLGDGKL